MKVCIDPGHGGTDPGASSDGLIEKNYNLMIGLKLRDILIKNNIEVVMTRSDDENLSNDERVNRVLKSGADICLSIHLNSSNGQGCGVETIYQLNSLNSKKLADSVLDKISSLGIKKRKSYFRVSKNNSNLDYYFMLRRTYPVNTIIVECLFIDNIEDKKFLEEIDAISKLAQKISEGVFEYFGIPNNQEENNEWSKVYFEKLKEFGIIQDEHNPNDIPTWAELCAIIVRTIEYIENNKNK